MIYHRKVYKSIIDVFYMTTIDEHKEIVKEYIDEINEKIRLNQLSE